jgi:hypothetical protein
MTRCLCIEQCCSAKKHLFMENYPSFQANPIRRIVSESSHVSFLMRFDISVGGVECIAMTRVRLQVMR